jgi:hypothetical protein
MSETKKLGAPEFPFTQEKADEICELIANGITLKAICDIQGMPKLTTVHKWIDSFPDFADAYARARKTQADTFADMVMTEAFNSHDAQIGRLRIDALKWTASKLAPKKYGDKVEVEQTGNTNFKISFAVPDRDTRDSLKELSAPVARIQDAEPIEAEIVESE